MRRSISILSWLASIALGEFDGTTQVRFYGSYLGVAGDFSISCVECGALGVESVGTATSKEHVLMGGRFRAESRGRVWVRWYGAGLLKSLDSRGLIVFYVLGCFVYKHNRLLSTVCCTLDGSYIGRIR